MLEKLLGCKLSLEVLFVRESNQHVLREVDETKLRQAFDKFLDLLETKVVGKLTKTFQAALT